MYKGKGSIREMDGGLNRPRTGSILLEDTGINVRKVHYMLHNIDMVISKIEAKGQIAPTTSKEFRMLLKLMHEVR